VEKWVGAASGGYLILRFVFCLFFRFTAAPASAELFLSVKENPHPEIFRGCIFEGGTRLIYVGWVILTVEEGGTLGT